VCSNTALERLVLSVELKLIHCNLKTGKAWQALFFVTTAVYVVKNIF
jgi:hypothetical protein